MSGATEGRAPVAVVGGGGFGQGIARAAARQGLEVLLWSRSPRNLEGVKDTTSFVEVARAGLIFLAVPSPFVEAVAGEMGQQLDGRHYLVHVSRGLVGDALEPISLALRRVTPCRRVGALGGPLVAEALRDGTPSGAVVGTHFPEVADAVRAALGSEALRLYDTMDLVGVEVASAMVGLLAMGVGYGRAAGAGPAALALVLTRGMAEAARLAPSLGADPQTLSGLAGHGDLLAVMAGDERPEVRLGRALAEGRSLDEAAREAGAHIEGVKLASRLAAHAERLGLEAPICRTIVDVLEGTPAQDAIRALMARDAGTE